MKKLAPLRKVIEAGALKETLECGHIVNRKQDIYGPTNAIRRRCRKCLKQEPVEEESR